MRIAIFGLSISSSWNDGHATLWRGLGKALVELGHEFLFFERDVPEHAGTRDWPALPASLGDSSLVLYSDWSTVEGRVRRELATCDAAIVSSYCFDAHAATDAILDARHPLAVFYDLDTPVTLEASAEHDWRFDEWTTSQCPDNDSSTCTFEPPLATIVGARFRKKD